MSDQNPCLFSINDFYTKYHRRVFLFAKSYVHNDNEAEDIVSEAIVCLWENSKKYEIEHPLTFLFSIIKNKSIDYLRHELTRQEAFSVLSDVGIREIKTRIDTLEACDPEMIFSDEIKAIVDSTLKALPEKTAKVFIMSHYKNLKKEEIASALGITLKGVEYHKYKALNRLRIALKDYLPVFYFIYFFR